MNMLSTAPHTIESSEKVYRLAEPGMNKEYTELSDLITLTYKKAYDAEVMVTYPQLLGVYDRTGAPQAALGIRSAAQGTLFLERYCDRPVEEEVFLKTGRHIPRHQIAEAGNLASTRVTALRDLMLSLSVALINQKFRYVLFTGTQNLKHYYELLGMNPDVFMDADPARLGQDAARWGRYYDTKPQVMGGLTHAFYEGLMAAYRKTKLPNPK